MSIAFWLPEYKIWHPEAGWGVYSGPKFWSHGPCRRRDILG